MRLTQTFAPLRTLYAKILPSGEDFTKLFMKQADYSKQASVSYYSFISAENRDDAQKYKQELFALEKEADAAEREVNQALYNTYMIPFDRTQITQLTGRIDHTVDRMKDVVREVVKYRLPVENDMIRMAEIAHNCSKILYQAVEMIGNLRENSSKLRELCDEIRLEEKKADQLFETACDRIFNEKPVIDGNMLAYNNLYELMEKVVDAYEDAADTLNDILIDYR